MTTNPKGCAATHATYPDVIAALAALDGIQLADTTDFFGFAGSPGATGALVQAADDGQVIVYWNEEGSHRRPDGTPFTAELKAVADKLRAAGWQVEPRFKVRLSARRPAEPVAAPAAPDRGASMDKPDDIQIGRTYTHVADLTRTVRVTRMWTDDDGHTCVAYDIFGHDGRGRPCTTHSALRADRFAQIYRDA